MFNFIVKKLSSYIIGGLLPVGLALPVFALDDSLLIETDTTLSTETRSLDLTSAKAADLSKTPIYPNIDSQEIFAQAHSHSDDDWPEPVHDEQIYWSLLVDQLEYRVNEDSNAFNWDWSGWIGGDYERLVIKSEGEVDLDDGNGEAELQVLYSRLFSPYWEWQVGLRYDQLYGDSDRGRGFAVIGVEGLAPYFFEVNAALFVSHEGDVSARVKAEYELLLTQQLILQPKVEVNAAVQRVEEFGIGSGINDLDLGLRLRYKITRQFAPYIGINWNKKFGETADLAQEEGESTDSVSAVAGLHLLF